MANQVLRDKRGVKIGEIQETSGKLVIRDARGVKKENTTLNQIQLGMKKVSKSGLAIF